jgi:predicted N-acetyltransferase YhbS
LNNLDIFTETDLTPELAKSIATLACRSFTSKTTVDERVAAMLMAAKIDNAETSSGRRFVIWEGNQIIAHARTFVRIVNTSDAAIPVLALATVCTDPDQRGTGLGAAITVQALELVRQTGWPDVSLFQTTVPGFYEKLNARIVGNRFVNRLNIANPEANPWRNDTVMVYPAEFPWPDGTIDLNGPDY